MHVLTASRPIWRATGAAVRERTLVSLACVLLGFAIIAARLILLALASPQIRSTLA